MPKTKRNAVPDRWTEYTAIGKVIPGTKFIALKVPLKERYFNRDDFEGERFTPEDLARRLNGRVSLLVDLSKKAIGGYYDPEEIEEHGIEYVKLEVQGHHLPGEDICETFAQIVRYFEENHPPDKLIGVHCTHGVNRTGYVITRYMVEHLQFTARDAISAFTKGRGHQIERDNYVEGVKDFEKSIIAWRRQNSLMPRGRPNMGWRPMDGPPEEEEWGPWPAHERGPWRGNRRGGMNQGAGRPHRGSFNRGRGGFGGPPPEHFHGPFQGGRGGLGPFRGGPMKGAGGPVRGRHMNRPSPYGRPPMRGGGRGGRGRGHTRF